MTQQYHSWAYTQRTPYPTTEISEHPWTLYLTIEISAHPRTPYPTIEVSAHPRTPYPTIQISAHPYTLLLYSQWLGNGISQNVHELIHGQ